MNNNKWEIFANKDAEYYVDTSLGKLAGRERKEKFFEHGRQFTDQSFAKVEDLLPDNERALEIGAGVGRLTLPHARLFQEIIAVDIAPTMLEKLKENAREAKLKNIRTSLPKQAWDEEAISYAYSYLVFQHIADFNIIGNYIQRIAGCLKKKGIAQLHFDTREKSLFYNIRNAMPDFLLLRTQKKGIRRIRRDTDRLKQVFQRNNLEIVEIYNHKKADTFIVLRKH